jgi:hypothetical protein
MSKKEFTAKRPKDYDAMSDIELIEALDTGVLYPGERDTVRSILDYRLKKVINNNLIVKIEAGIKATDTYSRKLIGLTWAIVFLTILMLLGLFTQIYIALKF